MEPQCKGKISSKIGFIGGGNMANAIVSGIVSKGLVEYSQIYVSGPHIESLNDFKKSGAYVTTQNGKVVEEADVIFISVKPHILPQAIANVYETMTTPAKVVNKLFVSILAGVTLESLENILSGFEGFRVIRVMPNTPMMVGEGCSVYCPGQQATEADISLVKTIVEVMGMCNLVPEDMINAVGALSGSGPAFIYLVIEALSDGGVEMGIPRDISRSFAAQTVLGAAKMVLETGKHTGTLKDEVCSPGGTTIAGIHALEKGGVRGAIMDAIQAAARKSAELGQQHAHSKKGK